MNKIIDQKITDIIKNALNEDVASGDITTLAIIPKDLNGYAEFLIKEDGVIAGYEVVKKVFELVEPGLEFSAKFKDGDKVKSGQIAATISGKASSILTGERTALNFFQRMSGIATYANQFIETVKHTHAKIIDTRKTVPGLRIIDKLAVKLSGCANHRIGLYDMFLIKDNHIAVAGSITKAIEACKLFNKQKNEDFKIEVETKNLEEVREALNCGIDVIMLDNFTPENMKKAVEFINNRCKVEASGGINLDTVKEIAETGVDLISVGALTHSVKALDISLNITTNN